MAVELLVGAAVMLGLLVAIFAVVTRGRGWYRYTPQTSLEDVGWTPSALPEPEGGVLSQPILWVLVFFVTMALVVGGVFAFATGAITASSTILLVGVGALVVVYLIGGIYLVARQRGHSNAAALFESITATGAVFLLLVVIQLIALG